MKDFAGNEINEAAMTQAIGSIDWSSTPALDELIQEGLIQHVKHKPREDAYRLPRFKR